MCRALFVNLPSWSFIMPLFKNPYSKEYYIVVQPYDRNKWAKRRWLVSANNLSFYIGAHNANTALLTASKMKTDKVRLRYRSFGIVDIYLK